MTRWIKRRSFMKYLFSLSAAAAGSGLSQIPGRPFGFRPIAAAAARTGSDETERIKKIAVEEHYLSTEYLSWLNTRAKHKVNMTMAPQGTDLGEGRLKDMDECGIDMQILSLAEPPGLAPYPALDPFSAEDAAALARIVNEEISEATRKHPQRFAGLACLPLQSPKAAADELERAVTDLGLKGAMVNDTPNRWLSEPQYEVIFERLAALDVPLYIHAMGPTEEDAGLHVVPGIRRLVGSGFFDKYPGLKIVLGHGGESLPFWLWRINSIQKDGQKSFMEYFQKHFYVSISAQFWEPLLQFLITVLGADRILFATDYPHPDYCKHVAFIDSVQIDDEDRRKICHLNAEKLFKL